jgi:von Willebrand factor type A domain
VTISWSLRLRRDRGTAATAVVISTLAFLLFTAGAFHPAFADTEEPRVIAQTASGSDASIVIAVPPKQHIQTLTPDDVSATVDGTPVITTVTPMVSSSLSVALVIDTAADIPADEFGAAQSGAAEFLLRLPPGARTMVVAAGGDPRIVAPLDPDPTNVLSAVSALRPEGTRSTAAGTLLAAQELAKAPAGPRAIVVYTNDSAEPGSSVEKLTQAVALAQAVINIVQTAGNHSWSSVVDRAGGAVFRTSGTDLVRSYGRVMTALSDQYLVAFEAPGALPAQAEVAVDLGGVHSTTVVRLSDAGNAAGAGQQSKTDATGPAKAPIPITLSLFALIALAVLGVLRVQRRASVDTSMPSAQAAAPSASPASQAPQLAMPPASPTNEALRSTVTTELRTAPLRDRSRRGSLSAAVQGRRSARQALDSAPERHLPHPSGDQPRQPARDHGQALPHPPDTGPDTGPDTVLGTGPRSGKQGSAAPPGKPAAAAVTAGQSPAADSDTASIVLTGSGDAVVELTKHAAGPAVVYIWGNAARRYFAIKTVRAEEILVATMQPYDGVRSLDFDGGESTGFRVRATGPWRIEVLPLSAIPTFRTSLKGDGDMVVHYTGHGSCAEINGNDAGGYFIVRAFSRNGKTDNLVNTNTAYTGTSPISGEPQYFEVHADGPWTITVK